MRRAASFGLVLSLSCMRPSMAMAPLPESARVRGEAVIGVIPPGEDERVANLVLPSRANLVGGTELFVERPRGEKFSDGALQARVARELDRVAGGWLADVSRVVELHRSLES